MNEAGAKNILKWVSMLFVLLSVIMLFNGAITIKDRDMRIELKSVIKSGLKQLNNYKDDIDDLQDTLDDYDIDISAKKLFKQAKKVMKLFSDAKISASEIASSAPSLIKLAGEIEDNSMIASMLGMGGMKEAIEEVGDAKTGLIILMVLFYATLFAGILTIVLHFIDSKLPGVAITVLNLIWLIIWGIAAAGVNSYADEEMDVEHLVKVTGAPIWGFLLAALALAIWILRDKIAVMLASAPAAAGVMNAAPAGMGRPVPRASGITCPVCGNALNEGAIFCPECGNKYEPPAPVQEPSPMEMPQQTAPAERFCTGCGAKLAADSVFCPNCGTRQQ